MKLMPLYIQQLQFITKITNILNTLGEDETGGYYLHVELREEDTHRKVGQWSDEIGPDCWAFELKEAES